MRGRLKLTLECPSGRRGEHRERSKILQTNQGGSITEIQAVISSVTKRLGRGRNKKGAKGEGKSKHEEGQTGFSNAGPSSNAE